MSREATMHPIAIVGASAIFPGSVSAGGFWRDILAGRDLLTEVPESHWLIEDYFDADPSAPDKTYARRGAFLGDIQFDPLEWGVPPSIVPATDTTQLLALIVAKQVLNDASGGQFEQMDKERISCILGVTSSQELLGTMVSRLQRPVWVKALREMGYAEDEVQEACDRIASNYNGWQESTFPGLLGNVVAGRIANRLDLGGTNCVTDAACASSFSALSMAVNELQLRQSDLVIAGGADTMNDIFMYMCFSKTPALSKSGDCRPFSDQADGTMLGEGLGMVALKRLDDAERDGDRIYAVITGVGASSDGRSKSVYAPVPAGQAKALKRAYEAAGYGPETVELVEAHGTGTIAGDAAEFSGLEMAFSASGREGGPWCALGSVKSQIGHTKAAAGAAGLFKAIMALHHKVLPPTIKVDRPNPKLDIEKSSFYLNTELRPWIRPSDHPRRASVSSFGFGGSNFHIALQEYEGPAPRALRYRDDAASLVLLSAADPQALIAKAEALVKGELPEGTLAHLARSTQTAFDPSLPARLAVVATDEADLKTKVGQLTQHIRRAPEQALQLPTGLYYANGAEPGKVAFVFPGQGSQYLGMGAGLATTFDAARQVWDQVADLELGPEGLHQVVFPRPTFEEGGREAAEEKLRQTEWAQPAIGTVSLSQLALLDTLGVRADAVGGHSFGEVTALHAAGVISAQDALRIARRRGELMAQAAQGEGAMIAVPLDIDAVRARVEGIDVVVANHNAPKQVVLSGTTAAIDQAEAALKKAGVEPKRLVVATAFHSPVVASSTEPFAEFLAEMDFGAPTVEVYANTEAGPYPNDADAMRSLLARQIASPVRFVEQIEAMYASGIRTFIEVGPGQVLTRLISEILAGRPHHAIQLDRRKKPGIEALHHGLGRLAVAGLPMKLGALWEGVRDEGDPRDRSQPRLALAINGSNYDKPYPPKGGAKALPKPNPVRVGKAASNDRVEVVEKVVEKIVEKVVHVPVAASPSAQPTHSPAPAAPQALPQGGMAPAPAPAAAEPWLAAWQQAQQATAAAHAAYQQAMTHTHLAWLQSMDQTLSGLAGVMGQPAAFQPSAPFPVAQAPQPAPWQAQPQAPQPAPWQAQPQAPQPTAWQAQPQAAPAPQPAAAPWQPAPQPTSEPDIASLVQSGTDLVRPAPKAPAPAAPAPASAPAPAPAAPAVDLQALMLEVVAEKTGYPADMLNLDMELESDLGVDSIKRVEILSAMRERAPSLPEVDPAELANLRTLGQIADHMGAALPAAPVSAAAPASAPAAMDLQALMLEVVAEKTGYPADMLNLDMELESDLGVDSIKRVEILSAMRERAPSLPEVDPAELANLRTLGQIADHMGAALPQAPASAPAMAPTAAAPAMDLQALMLEVVAEKTGYPADMLNLDMELESDLGVDSIKRVEILSAMRERAPSLPEVDPAELANLRTLGQIADHMGAALPAAPASAPAPATAAPAMDLQALMLEVVAEKTGYPADMLNLDMELESDLGVDSIKRVEILSAMRERAPSLPEVDPAELANLRTLGQIAQHMGAALAPAPASPAPAATSPEPLVHLQSLMLEVVAEKTGYPADMLNLDMELESDLGIDSIKRVEILSAMRERAPSLPEVDPAELANLRTLGQLVRHMGATSGAPPAAAPRREAAAPETQDHPDLGRYILKAVEAPAAGLVDPALLRARIAVIDDQRYAGPLTEALVQRGIDAVLADTLPEDAQGLIYLGALAEDADASVHLEAFELARELAPRVGEGGVLVTVQDTGGDFGLSGSLRAWTGGLPGLVKTAAQEWPQAHCKAIDLERGDRSPQAIAAALADELYAGGPELEVGLGADGTRRALRSLAASVEPKSPALSPGDVVLASGGARGVTAATLIALARAHQVKLVLLGRTPLAEEPAATRGVQGDGPLKAALLQAARAAGEKPRPAEIGRQVRQILAGREIRSTLASIEEAGGQARYAAVDVTDAPALQALLDEVRADWGPIAGIVHGAGVLADKFIADKTTDQFQRVFETKVSGLQALLAATEADPLRAVVMFSSVAGRCGNRGQCDYAMANEVLNKVAGLVAATRPDCRVKSLGWGPWDGGMVDAGLRAHFERLGVPLIPLHAGARMLVDELSDTSGEVELVLGGAPRFEPLASDEGPRERILSVHTSRASHPYLADHTIAGVPVVPVVMALEWFSRAAAAFAPGLHLNRFRDVKVLRGIKLQNFEGEGDWLHIAVTPRQNGKGAELALELRSDAGVHYRAVAQLDEAPPAGPEAPAPQTGLKPWRGDIYDGQILFHGETFQVIRSLDGVSQAGTAATLHGTRDAGWTDEPWLTDPAALDGGLQLALLWGKHVLGGATLPMAVGAYHAYTQGPPSGLVKATLTGQTRGRDKAISDIVFTDAEGTVYAELRGVETILRPDA